MKFYRIIIDFLFGKKCPECGSRKTFNMKNEEFPGDWACYGCGIFFTPGKKIEKMMWGTKKDKNEIQ